MVACGFQNGTHSTFSEGKTVTHNSCWPLCYALRVCIFLYHIHIGVPTFALHKFARYWTWNDYNYNLMSFFCSYSNVLDQKRFFEFHQVVFEIWTKIFNRIIFCEFATTYLLKTIAIMVLILVAKYRRNYCKALVVDSNWRCSYISCEK